MNGTILNYFVDGLKQWQMRIISRPIIRDFVNRFPLSTTALNKWYHAVKKADWATINDVKKTSGTCDYIGNDRYVFNIAGNNYRLIAMIHFKRRSLYIRRILTHAEYTVLSKRNLLDTL